MPISEHTPKGFKCPVCRTDLYPLEERELLLSTEFRGDQAQWEWSVFVQEVVKKLTVIPRRICLHVVRTTIRGTPEEIRALAHEFAVEGERIRSGYFTYFANELINQFPSGGI